jgi:hypothetical protein
MCPRKLVLQHECRDICARSGRSEFRDDNGGGEEIVVRGETS